jgi:purine nucleoside phosphorylase
MLEKIRATANFVQERLNAKPEIGIILGTRSGQLGVERVEEI